MGKIYQQPIINQTKKIINILIESNFFDDYEIKNTEFAEICISDKLTEKFIVGEFNDDETLFSEIEFDTLLKDIVVGSIIFELKKKGIVGSFDDENSDERFFLTKKGKEFLENDKY